MSSVYVAKVIAIHPLASDGTDRFFVRKPWCGNVWTQTSSLSWV